MLCLNVIFGPRQVAGFVHSPLLPRAVRGTTSWGLYHVTDWLPTIVGLAGGTTTRNFALDGAVSRGRYCH